MKLQISSGQGPIECEIFVAKFLEYLMTHYKQITVETLCMGSRNKGYKSVTLISERDLSFFTGSIKWVCQSTCRPKHKRKNWFIKVTALDEEETIFFDEKKVTFETFRSSGKGGQHVNKTESGVRATYAPLEISSVACEERSQHLNKKRALERLKAHVSSMKDMILATEEKDKRNDHFLLERGNADIVFEGECFKRIK